MQCVHNVGKIVNPAPVSRKLFLLVYFKRTPRPAKPALRPKARAMAKSRMAAKSSALLTVQTSSLKAQSMKARSEQRGAGVC
jgi:hypothetical protein